MESDVKFGLEHIGLAVTDIVLQKKGYISDYLPGSKLPVKVNFGTAQVRYTEGGFVSGNLHRILYVGHNVTVSVVGEEPLTLAKCPVCGVAHSIGYSDLHMSWLVTASKKYCPLYGARFLEKVDAQTALTNLIGIADLPE